jgi:hypothetical protein
MASILAKGVRQAITSEVRRRLRTADNEYMKTLGKRRRGI